MIAAFLTVLFLPTTLVTLEQQVCSEGFFGENCMFQCKCVSKCDVNGTCTTNTCQISFFGPMCQYYDGLRADSNVMAEAFLYDSNEFTCNTNPAATNVTVLLSIALPFLWFRIYVKENSQFLNFNIKLNQTEECINMRTFPQDNFVDVTCDNSLKGVTELLASGPIAAQVCSIYISLGRNAAMKQTTYQSTTFKDGTYDNKLSSSQNAVDGSTSQFFGYGSCTQTEPEDNPEWGLTFNRPQILLFMQIWNRDAAGDRLIGFSLEGLSEINSTTALKTDLSSIINKVYRWPLFSRVPTRHLRIKGARRGTKSDGILTLCEVQAYSETICPPGTFGLWCENQCECLKNEMCNSVTGICAQGCPKGFYGLAGFGCSMPCINCKDDVCDQRNGKCQRCSPGYRGEDCSLVCNPGFYGQDCVSKCSQGCEDVCDAVSGECSCRKHYAPPYCQDCCSLMYGQNCTTACSISCSQKCDRVKGTCLCHENFAMPNCKDCVSHFYGPDCMTACPSKCVQTCDRLNGTCTCHGNFAPPDCKRCIKKYYGRNCEERCPTQCRNEVCNQLTGNCLTCLDGYSGLRCSSNEQPGSSSESEYSWLYIAIPVGVGLAAIAIVCLFTVSHTPEEHSEMSDNPETSSGSSGSESNTPV